MPLVIFTPLAAYSFAPDPCAVVPMALILTLICTHLAFYRYLTQKRSGTFAIAVTPMQVLFFLGCVVSAVVGLIKHRLDIQPCTADSL